MNMRNSRLASWLGVIAVFPLATACGGPGSSSAVGAIAPPQVQARSGSTQARTRAAFYVSNLGSSVTIYPTDTNPNSPQPLAVLTQQITRSGGLWVDAKGTTYVVNECCAYPPPFVSVDEFKRGQTAPSLRIIDGLYQPGAAAVSSDGTVYVNDVRSGSQDRLVGTVVLYKRGETSPQRTVTLPDPAYGLEAGSIVFDGQGDALVATLNPNPADVAVHVFRISRGSRKAVDTGIQGAAGASLGIDAAGNLYTADQSSTLGTVAVFAPGAIEPTRSYNLGPQIAGIAVAPDGTLYATTVDNKGILEVAPGGSTIEKTFHTAGAGIALGQY